MPVTPFTCAAHLDKLILGALSCTARRLRRNQRDEQVAEEGLQVGQDLQQCGTGWLNCQARGRAGRWRTGAMQEMSGAFAKPHLWGHFCHHNVCVHAALLHAASSCH